MDSSYLKANMIRQNILVSLTVQFNNPVQPPQWSAPVCITQASVVIGPDGKSVYPPAYSQVPAAESDISDELLEKLQEQMKAVGLTVARIQNDV
jgi:hypothetical protein